MLKSVSVNLVHRMAAFWRLEMFYLKMLFSFFVLLAFYLNKRFFYLNNIKPA